MNTPSKVVAGLGGRPHPRKILSGGPIPDPRGTGQFFFDPARTVQRATAARLQQTIDRW